MLSEKVSQTAALEDRRMRRDLQDTFVKLADAAIQFGGRSEQGTVRRPTSPMPPIVTTDGDTDSIADKDGTDSVLFDAEKSPTQSSAPAAGRVTLASSHELVDFLTARIVPDLKRFLIEPDKAALVCTNIVHYSLAPIFRGNRARLGSGSSAGDLDATFALLVELTRSPAALKSWRGQVADAFADHRFFAGPPSMSRRWRPIILAFMAADKERFLDLIGPSRVFVC